MSANALPTLAELQAQVTPAMLAQWDRIVPQLKDLPAPPKRQITHWTGGGRMANAVDRAHYHYIVQHDLSVVPGVHAVATNMRQLRGTDAYAAHTGGMNSFSIGLAFAGMGTVASRQTREQVLVGLAFAAFVCHRLGQLPSNPAHLFTHAEAWRLHKVKGQVNDQKVDILSLPFRPDLAAGQVGPWLRAVATQAYEWLRTRPTS